MFEAFCQLNPEVDCELDAQGNLLIMSPSNAEADRQNSDFTFQLVGWSKRNPEFTAFGPTAGFNLSNGAVKSPDGTLVRTADWEALSKEQRASFPLVALTFVLEVRSSADDPLRKAKEKMEEYIACGAAVGWLVDPVRSELTVYRPGCEPVTLAAPAAVGVGDEVPGLVIDFGEVWSE